MNPIKNTKILLKIMQSSHCRKSCKAHSSKYPSESIASDTVRLIQNERSYISTEN